MRHLNYLLLVFSILIIYSGCITSHKFRDGRTKVLPNEKIIFDSIVIAEPAIAGFYFPSFDYTKFYSIDLHSRKDSLKNHLKRKLEQNFNRSFNFSGKVENFEDSLHTIIQNNKWNQDIPLQKRRFLIDSIFTFSFFKSKNTSTRLKFVFRFEIGEAGNASLEKFDRIFGSVIIEDKGEIIYYRQFRSNSPYQRRYFPKGSEDRKNFPHFPQWQIEKVVDALVDDLKKRVQ